MVDIVLYSNCKLTNEYKEVFSKQKHELYLDDLTAKPFVVDDFYFQENGILQLDSEYEQPDQLDFNYMSISIRKPMAEYWYYFITDIVYNNGIITIHYEIDLWATYHSKMNFNTSILSRAKILSYENSAHNTETLKYYDIPVKYKSTSRANVVPLNGNVGGEYCLFAIMQYYNTSASGEYTDRQVFASILENEYYNKVDGEEIITRKITFTADEVVKAINSINLYQQTKIQTASYLQSPNGEQTNKFYDIQNVIVVNKNDIDVSNPLSTLSQLYDLSAISSNNDLIMKYETITVSAEKYLSIYRMSNSFVNEPVNMFSYVLTNNFLNIGIGTYLQQFELVNNGVSKTINCYLRYNVSDIRIMLEFDNQILDITESFIYEFPFEVLSGEVQAQRKMARELQTINGMRQIGTGLVELGAGALSLGATEIPRIGMEATARFIVGAESNFGSGLGNIGVGIATIINANQPNFSSTNGTFAKSNGLLNAYYGVSRFTISATSINSNKDYVDGIINNFGYKVYYVGNFNFVDGIIDDNTGKINYLKYEFVSIYGNFSQSVGRRLEQILLNGVKIHYV